MTYKWYDFITKIKPKEATVTEKYIKEILAPKIQGDGGWVEFQSLDKEGNLTLVFRGECSKCLILNRCTDWIEQEIEKDLNKKIKVNAIRKRPYFQDV